MRLTQNFADASAADAVTAALHKLQEASGARGKAEQAFKSNQQALTDALQKLETAQGKAKKMAEALIRKDLAELVLKRAEQKAGSPEPNVGQAGEQGDVPQDQPMPENVSNERNKGNPLAQVDGSGIIREGTQGEAEEGSTTEHAEEIITEIKYKPSSGIVLKANPNKTTTVLGNFGKDMKSIVNEMGNVKSVYFGAKKGGFNVLNVPDDMYKGPDQFWDEINVKWLDEAIARGDDFILATKPTNDVLWKIDPVTRTKTLTGFGREYQRMIGSGYVYDALTSMMIRK